MLGGDASAIATSNTAIVDSSEATSSNLHADNTLDERIRALVLITLRRIEDDHVAAAIVVENRRKLVHQDHLIRLERPLHRDLVDPIGLGHEVLNDEEDDDGEEDSLDRE